VLFEGCGGSRGGGENVSAYSISCSRMAFRECVFSHGGGSMLARRWRLRSRASHRGMSVRCGGTRGLMGPCKSSEPQVIHSASRQVIMAGCWRGRHTPRSSSPSSLCRGMTVTSSISQRNAISGGVSPGGRGNAMLRRVVSRLRVVV